MHSFEAEPDIEEKLLAVMAGTGASLKEIVNSALRAHFPEFIRRKLAERKAAQEAMFRAHGLLSLAEEEEKQQERKGKPPPGKH